MIAAVRIVAGGATLFERGLMQNGLAMQFSLIGVTGETDVHCVRFEKSVSRACVRAVAIGAVSSGAWMLHFGGFDLLCLLRMTTHAQLANGRLDQYYFPVLGGSVTAFALHFLEGLVNKSLQQFGAGGLVRVVAAQAIRFLKWQVAVRLGQRGVRDIMAIQAQTGRRFREMENAVHLFAVLVARVATVATHVEGGVTTASGGNIQAGAVAGQAEIVFRCPGGCFEQDVLKVRTVGIVAGEAVAYRRTMDMPLNPGGILVLMTLQAQLDRRHRHQLDVRDVLAIHAHFVASCAAHSDGRVHCFAGGFGRVALETFGIRGLV